MYNSETSRQRVSSKRSHVHGNTPGESLLVDHVSSCAHCSSTDLRGMWQILNVRTKYVQNMMLLVFTIFLKEFCTVCKRALLEDLFFSGLNYVALL